MSQSLEGGVRAWLLTVFLSICRKAEGKAASTTELPPEYLTSPLSQQSQVQGPFLSLEPFHLFPGALLTLPCLSSAAPKAG